MPDTLQAEETALVLFDFLNGHVKNDDTARARYAPVIANAVRLLDCARRGGMMIAYANAAHRPDNATSAKTLRDTDNRLRPIPPGPAVRFEPAISGGTWEAQVIDELAPLPADYIIPKYRWSAFYQTCLDLALRSRQVGTIVLCGGSTDVGIASTAFAARDMDYHIIIASDACTSPEQDNHRQFMQRVFPRMARVRTVAQIESMLSRAQSD
ncbi:MAG: cysteine hydrolase [Betaproteobacteria bacterium]